MKRFVAVLIGVALLLGTSRSAQAQGSKAFIYAGGGASIPMSDYGDYAKTGWLGVAGVGYNMTANVFIQAEGMFGSNKHSDYAGDKTELMGASASIGYSFGEDGAKVKPYVFGGAGMLSHKFKPATGTSDSESKAMFYGGAGLYFPMGKLGLWVETRYVSRSDTKFVPVMAGLQINL
jgi:opacity protein-like surface antigen